MASIRAAARKVVCVGRNYADHAKELKNAVPKEPFFFLKPTSSILSPNGGPVLAPRGVKLHYEVELACIISRTLRDLRQGSEQEAMDAIGGYCLAIDMTARNVQDAAKRAGLPWTTAKGFDTFLPISNHVDQSRIINPHRIDLSLTVDGQQRQAGNTEQMIFKIPQLLGAISRVMALEPGDVVLTGTPSGVGEVKVGSTMEAELSERGELLAQIKARVAQREGPYEFREA